MELYPSPHFDPMTRSALILKAKKALDTLAIGQYAGGTPYLTRSEVHTKVQDKCISKEYDSYLRKRVKASPLYKDPSVKDKVYSMVRSTVDTGVK